MRYTLILLAVAALAQDRGTIHFPDFEMVVEAVRPAGMAMTALRAQNLTLLEDGMPAGLRTNSLSFQTMKLGLRLLPAPVRP